MSPLRKFVLEIIKDLSLLNTATNEQKQNYDFVIVALDYLNDELSDEHEGCVSKTWSYFNQKPDIQFKSSVQAVAQINKVMSANNAN